MTIIGVAELIHATALHYGDPFPPCPRFNLHFVAVPDIGMPEDVLEARREREANSLKNFMGTVEATPSLAKFSEWMHMEHLCYAVLRQVH